jgi:molecular chaperone IbpA
MTNTLSLRSLDIPSIHKFGIGFDTMFDELMRATAQQSNNNYPPYNIVKHSDDHFSIELAVAGFKEGDIDVQVEKNQLTVQGSKSISIDTPTSEYLHRGISARNFVRNWTLADYVEITGATVADGILTINLERKVPEEEKPKKIAVTYTK